MKEIADYLNENRQSYVFCGMLKFKNMLCYVGSYKITESELDEFNDDDDEVDISSFVPISNWDVDDFCNALDGELENRNYHSYEITPDKIIDSLPETIDDKGKIEILKKIFDFLIND